MGQVMFRDWNIQVAVGVNDGVRVIVAVTVCVGGAVVGGIMVGVADWVLVGVCVARKGSGVQLTRVSAAAINNGM